MTQDRPAVFGGGRHPQPHPCRRRPSTAPHGSWAAPRSTRTPPAARRCWDGSAATAASSASAWREPAPTARASPGTSRLPASTSSMRTARTARCAAAAARPTPSTRSQRHGPRSTAVPQWCPRAPTDASRRSGPCVRRAAARSRPATVAANQIDAVVVTAPEPVKDRLRALNTARTVAACARMRPGTHGDLVRAAAKRALRCLARRHQALTAQIKHLDAELRRLCERANPALLGACGVGAETAAALLVAAGDNPERLRSEASAAALCGTSPIEASSGPTVRHRLNRGGNRQANNALWRIAMVRLRVDERSIAYAARLTAEGKTRREIPRCLKRHTAREAHQADHRPARRRPRSGPAPPPHPTRAHHPPHSPSPRSRTQPDIRTRKRHHPQPRPRRTLPATPRTDQELTNIGASTGRACRPSPSG